MVGTCEPLLAHVLTCTLLFLVIEAKGLRPFDHTFGSSSGINNITFVERLFSENFMQEFLLE